MGSTVLASRAVQDYHDFLEDNEHEGYDDECQPLVTGIVLGKK